MAGSLVLIEKITLDSATAEVILDGIDSTYDVYMVRISNMQPATDNKNMVFHVTKSGSADDTSNYDHAFKTFRVNTAFQSSAGTNASSATFGWSQGNGTGEKLSATLYLFNFPNSSEYSFVTVESMWVNVTPDFLGAQGGIVHTVASASDGVSFTMESGVNINSGAEFSLYGLKK